MPLQGTCQEMCPEFERHQRELYLDLSSFEQLALNLQPASGQAPRINHGRAVKKYQRPAAGNEAPLPEDVRTVPALKQTMDYLVEEILCPAYDHGDLNQQAAAHAFVRDRTRAIRQDFTVQDIRIDPLCIEVHEQIARFHICSGHRLQSLPAAEFDAFQNTEQGRKVLQSLIEFYEDARQAQQVCENQGEFKAYHLLTHLPDWELCSQSLVNHPHPLLDWAQRLAISFHSHDAVSFYRLANVPPPSVPVVQYYLALCLLQSHFHRIRQQVMSMVAKAYQTPLPAALLAEWMGLDSEESFLLFEGGEVSPSHALKDLKRPAAFIEALVQGVSISAIITGASAGGSKPLPRSTPKLNVPSVAPSLPAPPKPVVPAHLPQIPVIATAVPAMTLTAPVTAATVTPPLNQSRCSPEFIANLSNLMCDALLDTWVSFRVPQIAAQVMNVHQQMDSMVIMVYQQILQETEEAKVTEIAQREHEAAKSRRDRNLHHASAQIYDRLVTSVVKRAVLSVAEDCLRQALLKRVQEDSTSSLEDLARQFDWHSARKKRSVRIIPQAVASAVAVDLFGDLQREREAASQLDTLLEQLIKR